MALEAYVNGQRKKASEKSNETLRFELELALPTDDATNEFSYAHLVADAQRKRKDFQPALGNLDDESDENLAAIARRLEEKYGVPKGKRQIHETDLVDKGYGYDTSDSFVDDTELYEDFVPPQVETEFGGFYVNTGELEFRKAGSVEDDDDMDFVVRKKPKIKKQPSHLTPQTKLANQTLKKAKRVAQKAPKDGNKTIKHLFSAPGTSTLVKQVSKTSKTGVKPQKKALPSGDSVTKNVVAPPTTSSVSLSAATVPISVGDISLSVPLFDSNTTSTTGQSSLAQAAVQKLVSTEESTASSAAVPKPAPVLPESLPADLHAQIKSLEESVAKLQSTEGKVSNKAKGDYDEKLADIEIACKSLTLKNRAAVMGYLSPKLGVSKGTLFKRVKNVLRKREDAKIQEPLQKLRDAVEASMPAQQAQYEEELRSKTRTDSTSSLSDRDIKMEIDEDSRMDDTFTDSQLPGSSQQEFKPKKPPAPRKKYKWTDETRKLLCDVVRVKVESEEVISRVSRVHPDELLQEFLDAKVKPIWPKGWMQRSILYKVSEPAHKHFTNPSSKKGKKEKVATTKKEPAAVAAATVASTTTSAANKIPLTAASVSTVTSSLPTTFSVGSVSSLKIDQTQLQPKLSLAKIVQVAAPAKPVGDHSTSSQTKPTAVPPLSTASGTGRSAPLLTAGKKTVLSGGSTLLESLTQTTLSGLRTSSGSTTGVAKANTKSGATPILLVAERARPSSGATAVSSSHLPSTSSIQSTVATTLATLDRTKRKPAVTASNLSLSSSSQTTQTPSVLGGSKTSAPGVIKMGSSKTGSSVVLPAQPAKASTTHTASVVMPQLTQLYELTSKATTTGTVSHSREPNLSVPQTTKEKPLARARPVLSSESTATDILSMLGPSGIHSPTVQRSTPSPASSHSHSHSHSPSPQRRTPSPKTHHSSPKSRTSPAKHSHQQQQHHQSIAVRKDTPSPPVFQHHKRKQSLPTSRSLQTTSTVQAGGGLNVQTAPPTAATVPLQLSSQAIKPNAKPQKAKTRPPSFPLTTAGGTAQGVPSLVLPVATPLSAAASSSPVDTPSPIRSPVEQIFEEHSYGGNQEQLLQLSRSFSPQQWTLTDTRLHLAQGQLLVTSPVAPQQRQSGGVSGVAATTLTTVGHHPSILLPVTLVNSSTTSNTGNGGRADASGVIVTDTRGVSSSARLNTTQSTTTTTTLWQQPPPQ